MAAPNEGGLMRKATFAIALCAVTAIACTTAGGPATTGVEGSTLQDVLVEHEGESTAIALLGVGDAAASVVDGDEQRLVIELSDVQLATDMAPIPVYDGLVEQVSLSSNLDSGSTRVEILLMDAAHAELESGPGGMRVWVRPGAAELADSSDDTPMDEVAETESSDPWLTPGTESGDEQVVAADDMEMAEGDLYEPIPSEESMALSSVEIPAPVDATILRAISTSVMDEGVLIRLEADGVIAATESFTLDGPPRLVVDLPAMSSEVKTNSIAIDSDAIAGVRIGAHSDKVRVVIDGVEGSNFDARQLVPLADGMMLRLGEGPALQAALDEASSAREAAYRESQLAMIEPAADAASEMMDMDESTPAAIADVEEADESVVAAIDEDADPWSSELAADEPVALDTVESDPVDAIEEADRYAWAADAADTTTEVVETGAWTGIHGVHYESDKQAAMERIVVLSENPVDWQVFEPAEDTFVVSIPNADLAEGAGGRIAANPNGPLAMISTFQQPDVEPQEVRVVVTRAPNLPGQVTRKGSLLFIEFAAPAGVTAQAITMPGQQGGMEPMMLRANSARTRCPLSSVPIRPSRRCPPRRCRAATT